MTTAIKRYTVVAKAPNSTGTFDGIVDYNPVEGDSDGERIEDFENVPGEVPLSYQHAVAGDPGAIIGTATTKLAAGKMTVGGKLSLDSLMAQAVHERMLLPDEDPMALKELSVGYAYDPSKNTTDPTGVTVIHGAKLLEISVVYRGAQGTKVTNVKALEAEVAAGLISLEQAMKFAADVDVDPELAESLLRSAKSEYEAAVKLAEAAKNYMDVEPIDGSFEDTQEDVREALQAWAAGQYPSAEYVMVNLVATFAKNVVFGVCGGDLGDMDPEYFQADYAMGADDTVTVSNVKPVDVTMSVTTDTDAGKAAEGEKAWDGDAAMHTCSDASDFGKIAFERNDDSDPDTASHWALPHHDNPGAEANPEGVSAALGALHGGRGGKPDLKDPAAAEKHLDAHEAAAKEKPDNDTEADVDTENKDLGTVTIEVQPVILDPVDESGEKAGRVLSKANEDSLRGAADALVSAGEAITRVLDAVTSATGGDEAKDEKAADPDADIKALLDELEA